jgi:hypothetical protein
MSNVESVVCLATLPGIALMCTLIATIQTQVSLQYQLLAEQTTLARQDQLMSRVGAALPQGAGMPFALLTAHPTVAQSPMILGDAQQEGYDDDVFYLFFQKQKRTCTLARIKA